MFYNLNIRCIIFLLFSILYNILFYFSYISIGLFLILILIDFQKYSYLKYFINGHAADIVGVNQTGGNREGLNFQNIGNISIPLPPLSEQEAIVERLDRETGKIDRAIEVKRRQIELLRERRQIVIDEVVTGKVKVA